MQIANYIHPNIPGFIVDVLVEPPPLLLPPLDLKNPLCMSVLLEPGNLRGLIVGVSGPSIPKPIGWGRIALRLTSESDLW